MRSPQTIGVEVPRPASGVFQAMFFSALHSTGTFFSGEMPSAEGPRHCGQFAAGAGKAAIRKERVSENLRMTCIVLGLADQSSHSSAGSNFGVTTISTFILPIAR